MKERMFFTKITLAIILSIIFSNSASARTISNTLRADFTINLSADTEELVNSFNKDAVADLKVSVDRFNLGIGDLSIQELAARQNHIDEYFGATNSINLTKLRNDYFVLSQIEKLAVAKKIKDSREELPGKMFLDYYRGQYAFLPAYCHAVNVIKDLNGNLVNVIWNDTGNKTKTFTVLKENETISSIIKATVEIRDFEVKDVSYIITCINDSTSEVVGKGVIDGVANGEKIVSVTRSITNEEAKQISLTFRQPGTYKITLRAEH